MGTLYRFTDANARYILFDVLDLAHGLSPDALSAIGALEFDTVMADGGRLKLEWNTLRSRSGDEVEDVLWWEDGRLVGFLGLYTFSAPTVEAAGMVHPDYRRRGIGSSLLDEAIRLCHEREHKRLLLVAPRTSPGAQALASSRRGVFEHSEHALVLDGAVGEGPSDPRLVVRPATQVDSPEIARILLDGFGYPSPRDTDAGGALTLVAERDNAVVATLRLERSSEAWGIYGFAVEARHRGEGIGRDFLRRACRLANDSGATGVHLEVEVDNDRALGLYSSLGFTLVATEDYFDIPLLVSGAGHDV